MNKFLGVVAASALTMIVAFNTTANANYETFEGSEFQKVHVAQVESVVEELPLVAAEQSISINDRVPHHFMRELLLAEEESQDITSTDDDRRKKALEEKFKISLLEEDHWYYQYPNYTAHETLKAMGYYHLNANREMLIKYAIRTDDWQPYRAYEAERTPLYFDIVDGKFEYTKIYYATLIPIYLRYLDGSEQHTEELKKIFEYNLNDLLDKFRKAPGIVPSVVHLNNREDYAKQYDVPMPDKDYYNSKYNHPDVLSKGKFKE